MQIRNIINLLLILLILSVPGYFFGINSGPQARPNFIFLLTDDQRWDALGCAGHLIIQTPNMDRLARQGTRFTNAFVTTPICAASRASIFTGLYERRHGYTFEQPPLKDDFSSNSYPVLLRKAGYTTGFIGKFGIQVSDHTIKEWFDFYKETKQPYFRIEDGKKIHLTDLNFDHAIAFIKNTDRDRPFCLSISTHAPHADDSEKQQYVWPESCDTLYRDITIPEPALSDSEFFLLLPDFIRTSLNRTRWYWRFDNTVKYQEMVKGYYRMISGIDLALGRLLQTLQDNDLTENTVIILMGDNGYFLGERGFAGKWTMHDVSIRVPFIIYDPRNRQNNQEIDELVLNIDLAPTLLAMAGIKIPATYQGESLLLLRDQVNTKWRKEILTEHLWDRSDIPKTEAIRTKQWKYIRYAQHPEYEELYHLIDDPQEAVNLADSAKYYDRLINLRSLCEKKIAELTR